MAAIINVIELYIAKSFIQQIKEIQITFDLLAYEQLNTKSVCQIEQTAFRDG